MPNKKGAKIQTQVSLHETGKDETKREIRAGKVAEHLNMFFANSGSTNEPPSQSSQLPTQDESVEEQDLIENPLEISHFSKMEVEMLVRKINVSKSSGINLLSSRLLKDSFQALSDKLTFLFNLSVRSNIFPSQWKKALVIPIPKPGDPHKKENYRPISLLPLPGKILEKLVHTQLTFYLEDNDLLTDNQFGFRKQRSTTHAISQPLNQIYVNMNRSLIMAAIYVNFSKAFNCVQHSILLEKLAKLNLHHSILTWISSYLQGREQRTLVNNIYSSFLPVPQGVPQGSVLGPLLYVIYTNDIAEKFKNSGFAFYADDIVLYSKKKSVNQAGIDLQEDLDSLTDWCITNKIYINTEKTKAMFFGSKTKIVSSTLPTCSIDDKVIQRAKTYTYLGIKLDE